MRAGFLMGSRLDPGLLHPRRHVLNALRATLQELISTGPQGGTVLDFGSGDAPYRPLFEGRCDRYLAADLPSNPQADVHLNENSKLPLPARSVRTVLSSQVLEHVSSPQRYLKEARRVLEEDGRLLLSTHGVWQYHPHPLDLRRWTRQGLTAELEEAGFEPLAMKSLIGPVGASLQLFQDAVAPRLVRPLRPLWKAALQSVVGMTESLWPDKAAEANDAAVYVVLARPR